MSPNGHKQGWREIGSDPDYRYSLANERTFLAWIRTSLGLLAAGVAVEQFAPGLGSQSVRVMVVVAFVVLGALIAGISHWQWARRERAMRLERTLPANKLIAVVGYSLAIVALVILVVLLV